MFITTWLSGLFAAIGLLGSAFFVASRLNRYDIVDSFWGPAIFVVSAVAAYKTDIPSEASVWPYVALAGTGLWAARLSAHIGSRQLSSKSEDPRYTQLRVNWRGSQALNAFIRIYLLQAVLAAIIAIPIVGLFAFDQGPTVQANTGFVEVFSWLMVAAWIAGFTTQVVADRQLTKFIQQNGGGKLMTTGLWRYSRHPNYLGEICMWWAICLLASAQTGKLWLLSGAVMISWLIIKVSGIPPLEKRFSGREGWAEYSRATSMLVPSRPSQRH